MLIPRFWASADGAATDREGRRLALRLWGWSQNSAADALELARRRVAEVAARLAGTAGADPYLYGSRQPLAKRSSATSPPTGAGRQWSRATATARSC